jgi:hypothetical protein
MRAGAGLRSAHLRWPNVVLQLLIEDRCWAVGFAGQAGGAFPPDHLGYAGFRQREAMRRKVANYAAAG